MNNLTLEEIGRRMDLLQDQIAHVIRALEESPARAYANIEEPIAVSAADVARMLSIRRDRVYQMHHAGTLNGFRPYPKSELRFLVSDVRALAVTLSAVRSSV